MTDKPLQEPPILSIMCYYGLGEENGETPLCIR